jgi:catechol 2,3-dioxygenase-like lactoylglutathione lyase family enzyme
MVAGPHLEVAHAVLHVRDLPTMIDFYCGVLDFEVTDRRPLPIQKGDR